MTNDPVAAYFARLRRRLVPLPAAQVGVCDVCRTAVQEPFQHCYLCRDHPKISIHSVSVAVKFGPLYDLLAKYKRSSDAEVRSQTCTDLAVILETFMRYHETCISESIDTLVLVPPSNQEAGIHDVVGRLLRFEKVDRIEMRWKDPEKRKLAAPRLDGQSILLLDDMFTSGKTIFEAVRVLTRMGAGSVTPLVIGRCYDRDYAPTSALLERLNGIEFDEHRCGVCGGVVFDPPLRSAQTALDV